MFQKGPGVPRAADLYNDCNKVTPAKSSEVNADNVAVTVIDADGEVITGYIGTETNFGSKTRFYQGDGGLIARFSDGTVTDSSWKAQSFYIAPLANPNDVIEKGNVHDTTKLGRVHPRVPKPGCEEKCYAVHYPTPTNWAQPNFDDSKWPRAYEFTDEDVGVTSLKAYTNFPELFDGSRWIWTLNLVLDNLILTRKTVK